MDINFINKILREEAIEKGLCTQWQRHWQTMWDADELIKRYKDGIDFCLLNNYPSNEFIEKNFDRDFLRENAILVNDSFSLLNPRIAVILGNSASKIRYNGWSPGTVYVRDGSRVIVTAKNNAFVLVHAFDECEISASAEQRAKVVVLKHNENVAVTSTVGNIQVKEELSYLKD